MVIISCRFLSLCIIAFGLLACAQTDSINEVRYISPKPLSLDEVKVICSTQSATAAKVEYITIPAELETVVETTVDTGHWGSELVKLPAEYNSAGSLKTPERTIRHRDIHPFPARTVERQIVKTPSYIVKRTIMHDGRVEERPLSDLCTKYRSGKLDTQPE